MVISWTPSAAVVTTPTPGEVDGAALEAGWSAPHPASRTTASVRALGGTRVLELIAGEPYASEARQVRGRPPSARRNRRPRRRRGRAVCTGAAWSPATAARPARPRVQPARPPRGSP